MKSFGFECEDERLSKTSAALRERESIVSNFGAVTVDLKERICSLRSQERKKEGHAKSPSAANSHTSLEVYIKKKIKNKNKTQRGEYFECIILFGKCVFQTCTHTITHSDTH